MLNIVFMFYQLIQSKILQTLIRNNFGRLTERFRAKAKHFRRLKVLQQSYQTIRCYYFVTIVTSRGDEFYRKISQNSQKTLHESFTRNNIIIIGIVFNLYFYFLLLHASSFISSRKHIFPMFANSATISQN